MRDIQQALQEHKEEVLKYYPEYQILGVFLYGSQNYNVATENSDVDTKAVIIPNIYNLAIEPVKTKTIELENGEHCEIMDIMHLVANYRKQNINFVETLFTPYCWINPLYIVCWRTYFDLQREDIAIYNPEYCVRSICGQAIHTLKQNKTDAKKYANGLRLQWFLKQYLTHNKYLNCIFLPREEAVLVKKLKVEKPIISVEESDMLIKWFEAFSKINLGIDKEKMDRIDMYMNTGIIIMIKICNEIYDDK